MQIKLQNQYKSLYPFESDCLPDFTVVTGKNGSGKSQLLELILFKYQNRQDFDNIDFNIIPAIQKIQYEGIIKQTSEKISHEEWKKTVKKIVDTYLNMSFEERELQLYLVDNNLGKEIEQNLHKIRNGQFNIILSHEPKYAELLQKLRTKTGQHNFSNIHIQNDILLQGYSSFKVKSISFAKEIANQLNKNVINLTESDFYLVPVDEALIDGNSLFLSDAQFIFYNYARRRQKNELQYFRKTQYQKDNSSILDSYFILKHPEPWGIINEILKRYSIDFYFKGIDPSEFTEDVPLNNPLYKKSTNTPIPFENLSSGEKVIIGLILKLFLSNYYKDSLEYPDLLLLDEPDAHLHPEMSRLLIDILNDVFVKQLGIKVILSTHSPSTIALCPEDSIYQLKNGENTQLTKISKDDALGLLTSFIPTLSINYKNHRQVFVESPTDVMYYQGLHDKHLQSYKLDYRLYFISNGYGKSNCDHVYKIVGELRNSGNDTSFGIVDWDLKNNPKDNIYVHGNNERYSVENFILDPIYIYCLLIDMGNAHGISEKMGLELGFNQYLLGDKSEEKLQRYVDLFFDDFSKKYPAFNTNKETVEWQYLNGKALSIPKEYTTMQGHEIVVKVKEIYSALNKFRDEGDLQKALFPIILKCYPFVPLSTIETIESLSK